MDSCNSSQQDAQQILTILYPLLTSPQDAVVRSIITNLRSINASASVLANTLYVFSKLLPATSTSTKRLSAHQTAFRDMVANLIHSNVISLALVFEEFDADSISLYIDTSTNHRADEKRLRTRLWFTQTRYNLFREESEGYAKVVTLLWDAMSPNPPCVESLIEDLVALIGQFDLDSNRIIELILSAASDVVSDLIAQSHLVPSDTRLPKIFCRLLDEFASDHVYNVVGAIFQSYHPIHVPATESSPAIDLPVTDTDKKGLRQFLGLVAVLIREGRMTVSDIWHHLSPRDNKEVFSLFLKFENELVELSKSVCSSTALPSQDPPTDPSKIPRIGYGASNRDLWSQYRFISAGPFSSVQYQKLQLISQLIGMCRWRDAMSAILHLSVNGEHVDVAADPHIAGPISKIVEFLLSPVMNSTFPSFYPEHTPITDAIDRLGGRANGYPTPVRTIDQLLSQDPDAPGTYVREMLLVLGPYARISTRLLYALCRLLRGRKEPEAINIMREVVLPATSLTQTNAGLANAIWDVLKDWSHTQRWELYGHLHNKVYNTCAVYQIYADRASYEMRYMLKRLTSEAQRLHISTFAKITHGQALAAFSAALDRIQGYPADAVTITPVVEACLNCTDLAVDMLIFLVLDRMADSSRSRLKDDGINVAQWYSTLSLFLGICLRKLILLSEHVEGVVSFLCAKLAMEPEALLITALSDIIKCVADIEVDVNLTAKQIAAQSGGPYLRKVINGPWARLMPDPSLVGVSFDIRFERDRRFAVLNLQDILARTGVHVWIGISIAQLTRTAVFDEDLKAMPLKLSANIVDRARSSLMQLSRFLDMIPSKGSLSERIHKSLWESMKSKGLAELITEMNVPTSSAVILISPILDFLGNSGPNTQRHISTDEGRVKKQTDVVLSNQEKSSPEITDRKETENANKLKEVDGPPKLSGPVAVTQPGTNDIEMSESRNNLNSSKKTGENVQTSSHFSIIISDRSKGRLSPMLVNAFWTLKLSDIDVSEDLYESELKRLRSVRAVWDKEYDRFRRHTVGETDRARRVETELRMIWECLESLEKERDMVMKRQKSALDKLKQVRDDLCSRFANGTKQERKENACYFLQECILPKSRVSPPDALYCAKFVLLLLEMDIPAIAFTEYFEMLLNLVPIVLRSCSENEALSFSRLIKEVLFSLEKWRSNKKIFESEVTTAVQSGLQYVADDGESKPIRHEQYCQWLFDIHSRLTIGVCSVVTNHEYLYSRNCLSILAGVAEVFPKVSEHSAKIEECVAELAKSELEDVRIASSGVLARLRAGKAKRVPEFMFRLKPHSSHTVTNSGGRGTDSGGARNSPAVKHLEKRSPSSVNSNTLATNVKAEATKPLFSNASRTPDHGTPGRDTAATPATPRSDTEPANGAPPAGGQKPESEGNENVSEASGDFKGKPSEVQAKSPSAPTATSVPGKRARSDINDEAEKNSKPQSPVVKRVKVLDTKDAVNGNGKATMETTAASGNPETGTPSGSANSSSGVVAVGKPNINAKNTSKEELSGIEKKEVNDTDGKRTEAVTDIKVTSPGDMRKNSLQSDSHGADARQLGGGAEKVQRTDNTDAITPKSPMKTNSEPEKGVAVSKIGTNSASASGANENGTKPKSDMGISTREQGGSSLRNTKTEPLEVDKNNADKNGNNISGIVTKVEPTEIGRNRASRGGGANGLSGVNKTTGAFDSGAGGVGDLSGGGRRRVDAGGTMNYRGAEKSSEGPKRPLQLPSQLRVIGGIRSSPRGRDMTNSRQNGAERGTGGMKRTYSDTQSGRIGLEMVVKRENGNTFGGRDANGRSDSGGIRNRRGGSGYDGMHGHGAGGSGDGGVVRDGYGDGFGHPNKRRRDGDSRRRGRGEGGADYNERSSNLHHGNRFGGGSGASPRVGGGGGGGSSGGLGGGIGVSGGIGDSGTSLGYGGYGQPPPGGSGGGGGYSGMVGWGGREDDRRRREPEIDDLGWQSRGGVRDDNYDSARGGGGGGSGGGGSGGIVGAVVGLNDRYHHHRERRDERRDQRDGGADRDRELRERDGVRDRDHRDRERDRDRDRDRRRHMGGGGGGRRRRNAR